MYQRQSINRNSALSVICDRIWIYILSPISPFGQNDGMNSIYSGLITALKYFIFFAKEIQEAGVSYLNFV